MTLRDQLAAAESRARTANQRAQEAEEEARHARLREVEAWQLFKGDAIVAIEALDRCCGDSPAPPVESRKCWTGAEEVPPRDDEPSVVDDYVMVLHIAGVRVSIYEDGSVDGIDATVAVNRIPALLADAEELGRTLKEIEIQHAKFLIEEFNRIKSAISQLDVISDGRKQKR